MSKSVSFVSSYAELAHGFRDDHMKLCFLWYDEIMLETLNEYRRNHYAEQIIGDTNIEKRYLKLFTDIVVPLERRVSEDLLKNFKSSREHGYPRWGANWEYYTYPEPKDAKQFAHNMLLAHIKREIGLDKISGFDVEHAEGRARVAIEAVSLWEEIQQEVPCVLEANYDERLAMSSAVSFKSSRKMEIAPFKLFETSVPSLSNVPWSDIINLKLKGGFDGLRKKLSEIIARSPNDLAVAQKELQELEDRGIDELLERYRPNVKRVALESMLSNLPAIPIANPFSAFFDARDTITEINKARDLSWLYLLRDVRDVAATQVGTADRILGGR